MTAPEDLDAQAQAVLSTLRRNGLRPCTRDENGGQWVDVMGNDGHGVSIRCTPTTRCGIAHSPHVKCSVCNTPGPSSPEKSADSPGPTVIDAGGAPGEPGRTVVISIDGRYSSSATITGLPIEAAEPSEPDDGWKAGALRLLNGHCPWCGKPILNVDVSRERGLRWACLEGCNP